MAVRGVSEADSKILPGPGRAIERVPAGVTAFIGRTLKGPVAKPVRIHGFAAFQQIFGGLWQPSSCPMPSSSSSTMAAVRR